MRKSKNAIVVVLILTTCFVITSCSGTKSPNPQNSDSNASTPSLYKSPTTSPEIITTTTFNPVETVEKNQDNTSNIFTKEEIYNMFSDYASKRGYTYSILQTTNPDVRTVNEFSLYNDSCIIAVRFIDSKPEHINDHMYIYTIYDLDQNKIGGDNSGLATIDDLKDDIEKHADTSP